MTLNYLSGILSYVNVFFMLLIFCTLHFLFVKFMNEYPARPLGENFKWFSDA